MKNNKPIKVPIEDVLDLHTFSPKDIPSLLKEYLNACLEANIYSVRIIHGKGKGFQKNRVRSLLKDLPMVASFSDASPRAGGWGATIVELIREIDFQSPAWVQLLHEGARSMGMDLAESQIAQFVVHARELMAWNRRTNLTAITDPVEIAAKHFLDTLPVSSLFPSGSRILDIGSGGGFPGVPLKVLRPDLHVMLIDASRKKVSFLKHIISALGLKDMEARHIRAEDLRRELPPESERYDVVISKAVSSLDRFLDQAVPLLRRPGTLIAMKGGSVEPEVEKARSGIEAEGLSLTTRRYRLPYLDIERCLVILSNAPGGLETTPALSGDEI